MSSDSFDEYFAGVWGARWPQLRTALSAPNRHVAWLNPWAPPTPQGEPVRDVPGTRVAAEGFDSPSGNPRNYYLLDLASVLAARALEVGEGDRVLDMCAAPGGKTLTLATGIGSTGSLVANDRSAERRRRLRDVVEAYLPPQQRERVTITGHDATKWGIYEQAAYDRVLLDAPCSGERHVLTDPAALREWSPARSKSLSKRQYAMLCAALDAVRVGGTIVYSTCSISPRENDDVVARLLKKRRDRVVVAEPCAVIGQATPHGWEMLPDRCDGWGPIWFTVLHRTA